MASREALLERIVELGGLDSAAEASLALRSTLAGLSRSMLEEDREVIAKALPGDLGASLHQRGPQATSSVPQFFEDVRRHEKVSAGFGREHAQVVCRVLAELVPEDALRRLLEALPEGFGELFRPPAPEGSPEEPPVARGARHHTLATGSPETRHPLSESSPPGAQEHSVAREANPEGESKLSSAAGMTQERLEESLATAHPDSERHISEASD
jgi:uncharacterized protein (DUF2267 family)